MCLIFKCSKITEITAAIFVLLWKSFTALRCRYCYLLMQVSTSLHAACTFWLERRRKSAAYALMHSYSATEVPWCVFIRSSGCITLLFQLKRLLNITSVAYRRTDKWHDKRRSLTASKVLEGNGLYKHYIQWLFWVGRFHPVAGHTGP